MLLKRHYNKPDGWVKEVDEKGDCTNPPPLSHLEVKHTGTHPAQHFSTGLVAAGLAEGWMTIGPGKLILHGKPEDLVYTITRVPGEYRTKDGQKEIIHYYDCVLDQAQHQRFCAQAKGGARG
jgi:hypothetical protein